MKDKLNSVKNFAAKHEKKALYVALAITAGGTALMFRNQHITNEFLKEHNLFDLYYSVNQD